MFHQDRLSELLPKFKSEYLKKGLKMRMRTFGKLLKTSLGVKDIGCLVIAVGYNLCCIAV